MSRLRENHDDFDIFGRTGRPDKPARDMPAVRSPFRLPALAEETAWRICFSKKRPQRRVWQTRQGGLHNLGRTNVVGIETACTLSPHYFTEARLHAQLPPYPDEKELLFIAPILSEHSVSFRSATDAPASDHVIRSPLARASRSVTDLPL